MSKEVPFKVRWLSGGVPDHWQIVEPRRIFKLVKEPERPGDIHLTPSQKYGVLPQEEYMKITGARVVQNLSGTQMQHVEPGDFISHLRTFQGGLELATMPGKVSPAYTVLRPTEAVYPGFFKHVLKSPGYISQIASVTDQLRDGQTMRYNEFNLTWLPLPPLDEQKKIADELDRELAEIDDFIAEFAKFSALVDERRLAAIDRLIEPLLDKTTPIKHLGTLTSGLTLGATYNEPVKTYPYLRVANVQAGSVDLREIKEVAVPPSVALENMLQNDDVLITEGGDRDKLGRGAIWSDKISPMLHQNHVFAFRCNKEKLLPEFLVYCLESSYARRYFENSARQSTNLASTNSTNVKNFKIPSATIKEQQKIIISLKKQTQQIDSIGISAAESQKILSERKSTILIRLSGG